MILNFPEDGSYNITLSNFSPEIEQKLNALCLCCEFLKEYRESEMRKQIEEFEF
jgi:hypothetical protein